MQDSLPILDWTRANYQKESRKFVTFDDFDPLPPMIHEKIRSFIKTEVPCSDCKSPQCSCSGAHRAEVCFLPGERSWIETHLGRQFHGSNPNSFPVSGDCTQLSGYSCTAGYYKPVDCISFPFQPVVVAGELVPTFAKNCTFHPFDLSPVWILERWKMWQFIFQIIPEWVTLYAEVPNHE